MEFRAWGWSLAAILAAHWAQGIVVDFDKAAIWSTIDKTDPKRLLRCVRDQ